MEAVEKSQVLKNRVKLHEKQSRAKVRTHTILENKVTLNKSESN